MLLLADDGVPHRVDRTLSQQPLVLQGPPPHRFGAVAHQHHRLVLGLGTVAAIVAVIVAILAVTAVAAVVPAAAIEDRRQPLAARRHRVGVRTRAVALEERVRRRDRVVVGRLVLHEQHVLAEAGLPRHVDVGVQAVPQRRAGLRVGPGRIGRLHHQRPEQAVRL